MESDIASVLVSRERIATRIGELGEEIAADLAALGPEADVILVIGCPLDNLLNFGNPPLFPEEATLICVNGSSEGAG